MVAVFERRPEVAVEDAAEVAQVLAQEGFIEVVFGVEIALDFRGGGDALAVERPAGTTRTSAKARKLTTSSSGRRKMMRFRKCTLNSEFRIVNSEI
jgi:hypothetical protein